MNCGKKIITSAFVSLCLLAAFGLRAEVRWLEFGSDFGLMHEEAGPRTMASRMVNMGPDTISVFSVRPSCGCTSADFSEEPLAPGDTAVIRYTYDPHMRPGKFEKSVKVRLSDGSRYSLPIRGNVLGTPTSLASLYPVDAGRARLSDAVLNLDRVSETRTPVGFVNTYLMGPDSVAPAVKPSQPWLKVSASSPKGGPGDLITYSITLDALAAARQGHYGPVSGTVEFTADPASEPSSIRVLSFITPDPKRLIASQKGKNPRFSAPNRIKDWGEAEAAGRVTRELQISNSGNGKLHILRAWSGSPAVEGIELPKEIKPGKTGTIKVTLNPSLLPAGPSRIEIGLITDDPDHAEASLTGTIRH